MDVQMTGGDASASSGSNAQSRDLIKTVRSLEQTGPGKDGEHIERLWSLLTSVSASPFYAVEESALRWLLKTMKTNNDAADTLRRFPLTWRILACTFQRIPLFSLAKSLADRKFVAILQQTLKSIAKTTDETDDSSQSTKSKKRKRTKDIVKFDLEALKTSQGCLSTVEALLAALRVLTDRLVGPGSDKTSNDRMGAEHIKALFSQPAAEVVANIVAPLISLCDLSASSDLHIPEGQENWISTISTVWSLRLHGQADALEVAMFLSRMSFSLLGKLSSDFALSDAAAALDDRARDTWRRQLVAFIHRNLMLPGKSAFMNHKLLEIPMRSMLVAKPIATVSVPVFFHLAATTPRLLAGPSVAKAEDLWMQEIFKLALSATSDLSVEVKAGVLKQVLSDAIAAKSSIGVGELRAVCQESALVEGNTDWKLLSLVAQCDADVFLLGEEGDQLFDTAATRFVEDLSYLESEEDGKAAQNFLDAVVIGFEKTRNMPAFLKKWHQQLAACDSSKLSETEKRPLWFSPLTYSNPHLVSAIEKSMTPGQLLDIVQWVDEQQEASRSEASLVILHTIASSLSSSDFTDAVGTKLFDLARKIWSAKGPEDIQSLRWHITAATVSWVDYNTTTEMWSTTQKELSKLLKKGPLESCDTFQAFACATRFWLALFPDGAEEPNLSDILKLFAERIADQVQSQHIDCDPHKIQLDASTVTPPGTAAPSLASYFDYIIGFTSRLLPLLSKKSTALPSFLQKLLDASSSKDDQAHGEDQLEGTLKAVLHNETAFHEHGLVGKVLNFTLDTLEQGSKSSPWTDARPAAALKAIVSMPDELLSRQQRERMMEILWTQRRKMKSKIDKVSPSTWNLVLGVMIKTMSKPTFYSDMAFEDLTTLASSIAPALAEADTPTVLGISRLLYELTRSAIRQMHDHLEEWGAEYFKKAVKALRKTSEAEYMTLPVYKALFDVLSATENTKAKKAVDLGKVEELLLSTSLASVKEYAGKWPKLSAEDNQLVNNLLLSINAIGDLPVTALEKKQDEFDIKGLEKASSKAISKGLLRGWTLRTFLIRYFPKELMNSQPTDFDQLFSRQASSHKDASSAPDPLTGSDAKQALEACVDAVLAQLSQSDRLLYVERLLNNLRTADTAADGQLLSLRRVIEQTAEDLGAQKGSAGFDLATTQSKLVEFLVTAPTPRTFCRTANVLCLLLEQKGSSMTQWNIETTMSAVCLAASGQAAVGAVTPATFTSLCKLVSVVIRRHRVRLEDHYHILLTTMESLLRALILHATRPKTSTTATTPSLGSQHATMYSRLVTLITEPSAASVSRSQHVGALDSATDAAKRTAGRHVYLILMLYVKLQLEVDVPRDVQEAVEPGMNSIFDLTPPEVRKILNDAMDTSGRAILREMFKRYTQFGKWSGV